MSLFQSDQINTRLDEIDRLIRNRDIEFACQKIDSVLADFSEVKIIYAHLVNLFLAIPDFQRAKELFSIYKGVFNEEMVSDFSVDEIDFMQNMAIEPDFANDWMVFRWMTASERGHFSQKFRFFPVKEIAIKNDQLRIKQRNKYSCYKFSDVASIAINLMNSRVFYGGFSSASYLKREMKITVDSGKTYAIDVSTSFPDLKGSITLERELKKKIGIIYN